jgi:OHCU decarboxylase
VVALLAKEPGIWLPVAGGTDVMVLYGAGKLNSRKLVNIWNLTDLRRIEESSEEITIGAGCTYTDLRQHSTIAREFPLLTQAASWTGGIANQNRGTLGGNIANASPAADCLPALLAYEAEVTLISVRGERRIAYRHFHTGYKKTQMAADELIRSIHLDKKFTAYLSYARKVGARNSQAIAKVSIAALGRVASEEDDPVVTVIKDVRIALGAVAPVPLRLDTIERALMGKKVKSISANELRRQVVTEIAPIADIRSTAEYRATVAANLVLEFLRRLVSDGRLNETLLRWNRLGREEASRSILPCCGAHAWADAMAMRRPFASIGALQAVAREIWWNLDSSDWMEAFRSHPRIGESRGEQAASAQSQQWSSQEQRNVAEADNAAKAALVEANRRYEERFGRIFIVCATGKSPGEILEILHRRLQNSDAEELRQSAEEQQKIMQIRLQKWLKE